MVMVIVMFMVFVITVAESAEVGSNNNIGPIYTIFTESVQ